jgi:hypothetical protein
MFVNKIKVVFYLRLSIRLAVSLVPIPMGPIVAPNPMIAYWTMRAGEKEPPHKREQHKAD